MTSVVWTILSRLVLRMPALAGVILVSFALTRLLPGDPAVYFAGAAPTPEAIADLRRTLLLDQPLYAQFFAYLGDLAHGNFGRSLVTGQSVVQDLSTRLPATLELTIASTTLALLIAVPLGIVGARQKGSAMDHVCRLVSTSALAMPAFFTALLLVFLFYYLLGLAPAPLGRLAPMAFPPPERTGFMIIDASLARDLAVLSSDFIRAARGFDLPRWKLIYVYALRNAMLPVLTTAGFVFSFLISANVVIEKVFSWPGIGSYALEALVASDYAAVQGFVLAVATLYVLINIAIDILYGVIDVRVRLGD